MKRPAQIKTPDGRKLWDSTVEGYSLESHHLEVLLRACLQVDRAAAFADVVQKEGVTTTDRYGKPRIHPAVDGERQAVTTCSRLLRELQLDFDDGVPGEFRTPRIAATTKKGA